MGIYGFKPAFRRLLAPVARSLAGVHPDILSYAAVAVAGAAGTVLAIAHTADYLYLVVLPLLFIRIALNALDGMVAQSQGVSGGPKGEVVNEFSDRVSDVLIFGGLMFNDTVPTLYFGAVLAAVLLVSYVGILARAIGAPRNYAGPFGKADRMFWFGLACIAAYTAPRLPDPVAVGDVWTVTAAVFVALAVGTIGNRLRQSVRAARSAA